MNIYLLNPCHENWDKMPPGEKGRFCAACQKQVIDFTHFTPIQISQYLQQNPNACGRFYKSQLVNHTIPLPPLSIYSPVSKWTKRLLAAALLLGINTPIFSQDSTQDSLPKIAIKGYVIDKAIKQPVPFAEAILYEVNEDSSLIEVAKIRTDQKAGYFFGLEENKNYKIIGKAEGYIENSTNIMTKSVDSPVVLEKNIGISLELIALSGKPITLQNIYFDENKYFLRNDAKFELDKTIELLKKNPGITIAFGVHCDVNEANENKTLSEKRAQETLNYFIDNGIAPARLSSKNFGDEAPIFYPPKTEEEEQVNRRIEFRITGIDYKEK